MIEGVQHLSQPRVGAALQHLGLQRAVPELSSRDKASCWDAAVPEIKTRRKLVDCISA